MRHNEDLIDLNLNIVRYGVGRNLSTAEREYVQNLPFCLAKLKPTAEVLRSFVSATAETRHPKNSLDVISINRDYLNFARLVAKDILAGSTEEMVMVNLTWDQAVLLSGLTNKKITHIAACWEGLVFSFQSTTIARGAELHPFAALYHAAALQ